ncbi:hypothetical protein [Kamptonema sp. PCC 6506]|uniref:hypothetical protein n=1 Tax=Kamptonema sp. PCC 6506 TaxID=272129 RepID=UPI0001DACF17|nr:hypothetical protein [Kamptonema sp. PCC 6506]CBN56403.1 hypothetical protein OSCI_3010007 [Kamptonema sp. PCC 6506]
MKLLDRNHPNYKDLETSLVNLDKAVSLNLSDRDATATPDDWRIKPGRDMIIERVSIAYWSEKAFRERSQWMHWNLRIAGALELALFLLLEKQGNGNYQWEEHKLMFTDTKQKVHIRCDISQIVSSLLANGKYEYDPSYSGSPIPLKANQITGSEWANFKKFYIDNWKLEEKPEKILGYIAVRNQLYHSLMGDRIDRMLDKWLRFVKALEQAVINHPQYRNLFNGQGWRVIHNDCQYLWYVYAEEVKLNIESANQDIKNLHELIEKRKVSRQWKGTWWGGRSSPSDGCLSIWHPGLRLIYCNGTWGMRDDQIQQWWNSLTEESDLSALFSKSDRLNSIELVKRLASIPEIIESALHKLWRKAPPPCPWGTFPDRTAVAATWVCSYPQARDIWNQKLSAKLEDQFKLPSKSKWGMKLADREKFRHPHLLERRNVEDNFLQEWEKNVPQTWGSTIEWTVGLNEAYKKAKERGKNRVCVRVLFNSGQSLEWVCPWPLWNLLMAAELRTQGETELNRWEKLLFYFESVRLRQQNIYAVQELLTILWKSVGLDSLTWDEIEQNSDRQHEEQEIGNWQWWINWISLRAFLARQERDRQNWLQSLENLGRIQP